MYLYSKIYVWQPFKKADGSLEGPNQKLSITGLENYGQPHKPIQIDVTKVQYITLKVGQWRKANAIHAWFVANVQAGEYVAIPQRSWRPMPVKVEQTTKITIG